MRFLDRVRILSIMLATVFIVSAIIGVPRISNGSVWSSTGSGSSHNTIAPIGLNGFTKVGDLAPSTPVIVTVSVPLRNLDLLQSMLAQVSDPQSLEYRHFLNPEQVNSLFLPVSQFENTLSYLQSNGFSIISTAEDSMISAVATVSQIQSSLGLQTLLYSNRTQSYYAASGVVKLPGVYAYASNVSSLILQHPNVAIYPSSASSGNIRTVSASANITSPIEAYPASNLRYAYNASSLVSSGYDGKGKGIGILEFYGDPYVMGELTAYDQIEGLPNPPSFVVEPVGPYNPSLGVALGAAVEVSLDSEMSHTMAPGANITMYVGNGALPFSSVIAKVDSDDVVNVFSQSWDLPELYFSYLGPLFLYFNAILSDQYYALGSLEGITFTAASGDRGGTGFSGQPFASQSYPSSSPFVTSVGGTTTYLTFNGTKVVSSYQTAWSNEGFEPTQANFGGGTGGVSSLEPRPWFQSSISEPASYLNGRMTPDVSLNANVWPGILQVVDSETVGSSAGYSTIIDGGTSEAAPLLAGLVTLIDQKIAGSVGLLNPALYTMGESTFYTKDFTPITFGYISPWVSSSGYNLATGWGAPNIGAMTAFFSSLVNSHSPSITGTIGGNTTNEPIKEFTAGQNILVNVNITAGGGAPITAGSFGVQLATLQNITPTAPLAYNNKTGSWSGQIVVPSNDSGLGYINVNGSIAGSQVYAIGQVFVGYLATILSPLALPGALSWSASLGFRVTAQITDLSGANLTSGTFGYSTYSYLPVINTYEKVSSAALSASGGLWSSILAENFRTGTAVILLSGAFGAVPFMNGAGLTTSFIIPPVNAEPGTVSPGSYLEIQGAIQAPANTPDLISVETGQTLVATIQIGSNLTASLVSPGGKTVSVAAVGPVSSPYLGGPSPFSKANYLGYLQVPRNATQGIYTVLLNSTYESIDLGTNINGSYFGQVMVSSQAPIIPKISITPGNPAEGQSVQIAANIAYSNGTEVKYGLFSAALYPAVNSNNYTTYSGLPAGQIPLWYSTASNLWIGNASIPSPTSLGWIGGSTLFDSGSRGVVTQPVSGPWYAYVSGVSADGMGTSTLQSAQSSFSVQPLVLVADQTLTSASPASELSGDTIASSLVFSSDSFVGTNTIQNASVTIQASTINGTLVVENSELTLVGVSGGNIDAINSKISLQRSGVNSLTLTSSQAALAFSSYQQVTPALATISVLTPVPNQNFNGSSGSVSVIGQNISSVAVFLDGASDEVASVSGIYSFRVPTLPDGEHQLKIVATQDDGLNTTSISYFSTNGQIVAAGHAVNSLSTKLNGANNNIANLTYIVVGLVAAVVIALVMGISALNRARKVSKTLL